MSDDDAELHDHEPAGGDDDDTVADDPRARPHQEDGHLAAEDWWERERSCPMSPGGLPIINRPSGSG